MPATDRVALEGAWTALVTPMLEGGSLDLPSLQVFVDFQVDQGIDGLVACGTTGESATLSPDEQRIVVEVVVAAADGRVPVMAGAGGSDTRAAAALARAAVSAGAGAVLTASPPYNKPTRAGLVAHYAAIAEAADGRPVVVYNVPGRTASNLLPDVVLELARIDGIAGVKEASGQVGQVDAILAGRPEGFAVLSGDDALTLPLLALGADGVISVVSNEAPAAMVELVAAGRRGDLEWARQLHRRLAPLMELNFVESNPIPVKTALAHLGLLPRAHFRLPLVPMSEGPRRRLLEAVDALDLPRPAR